jgi:hypothetical protein
MPFENLVLDLLAFNYQNRQPHDLAMSCFTGLIYMDKLFHNRGSIFQSQIINALPQHRRLESDILSGLVAATGGDKYEMDILELQAKYRRDMRQPQQDN